jgi:hypothetical protein
MKTPHFSALTISLLGLFAWSGQATAEIREFKSAQGSVIRAELKKAKGQTILMRREDGKELQVALNAFSKEDQLFILKWMAEDPNAIDYNFVVKADEKTLTATKRAANSYSERISTVQKNYAITINNGSRNTLEDVTVAWCAFMLDKITLSTGGAYSYSEGALGELRVKHGNFDLPKLGANHTATLNTSNFNVDSSIDKYYTGQKTKDKLQGLWLRFYRGSTMVFEWKSPDCPKTEWPGGAFVPRVKPQQIASNERSEKMEPKPAVAVVPPSPPATKTADDSELGDIVKIFQLEDPK